MLLLLLAAIVVLVPLLNQSYVSLQSGDAELGYRFTWNFSTYSDAISSYHEQFVRSLMYAGAATVTVRVSSNLRATRDEDGGSPNRTAMS